MRTAYVVACWFGERRVVDHDYLANRGLYIEWQIKKLGEIKHSFDSIIFVVNENGMSFPFPDKIGDTDVEHIYRPNIGMSYAAWDLAYQTFKNDFDFFFFMEDDYIPFIDNFDDIFMSKMAEDVGYVCSLYNGDHASISNGMVRTQALNDVGWVPHAQSNVYGQVESFGQVGFSKAIEGAGWKIDHVFDDYSIPFMHVASGIINYGNGEVIIAPVQYARILEKEKVSKGE